MQKPLRRFGIIGAGLAAVLGATLAPVQADDSSTVTVVGTSDVYDSGLIQLVIKPMFQAAYPQYTLNYVSKGSGAAITYAEAGTASALLVHAPSIENQFVDPGNNLPSYSLEPAGRAVFYGDYVLLGPASDPAGVKANASHDIVQAFEDIAAAGSQSTPAATFVSRGSNPGTTIAEHQIWAATTGVATCNVPNDANGGGTTPSTTNVGATCPSPVVPPSWYKVTGLTQGPNVLAADTCTGSGYVANGCYVFTDRGTYDFLKTTGQLKNLQVVTRDNSATAPLGQNALLNTFHAYAVNPAAVPANSAINTAGATAFLNFVTSPAAQAAIGAYLQGSDTTAPFLPDAAPKVTLTSDALPASAAPGTTLTVSGTVANVVPSAGAPGGEPVTLTATPVGAPGTAITVASTTTGTDGSFTMSYKPSQSYSYSVATPEITKDEYVEPPNADFSDQLAAQSTPVGSTMIKSSITLGSATSTGDRLKVKGKISPQVVGTGGSLELKLGTTTISTALKAGAHSYNVTYTLPSGHFKAQLVYSNPTTVVSSKTAKFKVTTR
jgi:tungstate transport system substrate-binding protein